MADEKVNMGPEENKPPETLSPPGQGNLPPLEENNAPAVSGEDNVFGNSSYRKTGTSCNIAYC